MDELPAHGLVDPGEGAGRCKDFLGALKFTASGSEFEKSWRKSPVRNTGPIAFFLPHVFFFYSQLNLESFKTKACV